MADSWQRQHLLSGIAGDARFISANTAEWRSPALVAIAAFFVKTHTLAGEFAWLPQFFNHSRALCDWSQRKRHFTCHDISSSSTWCGEDSVRAGSSVLSLRVWAIAPQPERISRESSCFWAITVIYSPASCVRLKQFHHMCELEYYVCLILLCTCDLTSFVCFVSSYQKVLCAFEMWRSVWCIKAVQIKGLEKGVAVRHSSVA